MVKILSFIILITAPFFMISMIVKTKAFFAGRKGLPFFQPFYEINKLLNKHLAISKTTGPIFIICSIMTLICTFAAAMFIPIVNKTSFISFNGDIILFVYLLGLARFCMILTAMDTGSSFEGMGSAREATFSMMVEPALFLCLIAINKGSVTHSLSNGFNYFSVLTWIESGMGYLLIFVSLFIILLVENSRIPFDDPNTHLELTMIHEVIILDHSGPLLGIMEVASYIKHFIFASLIVNLLFPFQTSSIYLDALLFCIEIMIIGILVGITESVLARVKLRKIPTMQMLTVIFAGLGMFLVMK